MKALMRLKKMNTNKKYHHACIIRDNAIKNYKGWQKEIQSIMPHGKNVKVKY